MEHILDCLRGKLGDWLKRTRVAANEISTLGHAVKRVAGVGLSTARYWPISRLSLLDPRSVEVCFGNKEGKPRRILVWTQQSLHSAKDIRIQLKEEIKKMWTGGPFSFSDYGPEVNEKQ